MKTENEAIDTGKISDGYHTFDELYFHRMCLFAALVAEFNVAGLAWKSKKHHDGTFEEGWFIVGIETMYGQVTYHYQDKYWDLFNCKELERAHEFDFHTPKDACIRIARTATTDESVIQNLIDSYPTN